MKKSFLIILFALTGLTAFSQFNQDAPWMRNLNVEARKDSGNPVTFQEIVDAFDAYWIGRDHTVKGSGYKPFKRWESFWKNHVKEDGTLPTAAEFWATWESTLQQRRNSQMVDMSDWFPVGPFELTNTGTWSFGQGRVNAIIVDPNNPNTYYAGAPAGGIWKSLDAGASWTPLSDFLPQIGVSGIAVDYNNSDIVYIATGDDDAGDSYSVGVMKSVDGGSTWQITGLNPNNSPGSMNDIYMHPSNSNILWVATSSGVFKTTNAGSSWSNKLFGNIKDIKLHPTNPNIIYAVTTNTFYKSTNGGESFFSISNGVPTGSSRLVIDVTPDNPDVVYILSAESSAFKGLYKSSDSGSSFSTVSTFASVGDIFESPQAWYDMAMAVSDTNEDEVYVGVLNIWKTTNSGTTFTKINSWSAPFSASYTHADIHLLRFFNGQLFAGTDGGFYKSANGGINFTDLTQGMQIGQFYKVAVSKESSSKMVGGLQDNGGQGLNNNVWQNYYGADGMDTAIDPNNSNLYYGFIQNGGSLYISTTSGGSNDVQVGSPSGEDGNWITPLSMSRDSELYSGFSSLYKLCGNSWQAVSPNLGTNIDLIEIDELNPDIIYVATNEILRKSEDRGVTFSIAEFFPFDITSIEVNNNDDSIVYVTTSGSINGQVFKSVDQGLNFTNISSGLPAVSKNVIKHQGLHPDNPLFLGTSLGVYRYDDITQTWEAFNNNLPTVPVRDLEINLNDAVLVAATYGRGIWKTSIPNQAPSEDLGIVSIQGLESTIACGEINSFQVELNNSGLNPITSATIAHTLDGNTQETDWTGNLLPGENALVNINRTIPTSGDMKLLNVEVSSAGDIYPLNNSLVKQFANTASGIVNEVNTFETPEDELIVYDDGGLSCSDGGYWQRGIPTGAVLNTANSGSMVYGTNLSGDYDNNIKSYLVSGCYNLTNISNPILRFNMQFELEFDWDIVYVEYSTDSGASWSVLGSALDVNWYNSDTVEGENNTCYNCPGAQWTGANFSMQEYNYNLSGFTDQTSFMVRFVFHTDQLVVEEGVVIDDFRIEGTLGTNEITTDSFHIYPNPSNGIFTVAVDRQEPMVYNLYDVTGKMIFNNVPLNTTNSKYTLDLSNYQTGVYFIQIQSASGSITKKLIID